MKVKVTLLFVFSLSQLSWAQKTETVFNVFFKDKSIGTMRVVEEKSGTKSIKDLSTQTDAKILAMSIHVESEVKSTHENGILIQATSYRHANRGAEDVHAKVTRINDKNYVKERNGVKGRIEGQQIDMCLIDLFFREPKGVKKVFSNMYAEFLIIKEIGAGKYRVITPDNKDSYYTYKDNKLTTVESNTPLGKVISRRV
jgi:hypothetical protein